MKLTINPVGRCSKSNHQQYRTQNEALQVANVYKSSVSFEVYQCPHCGYWELKKKQEESTEVSDFIEEPTDPIADSIKLLSNQGYWVIQPDKVEHAYKILSTFKQLTIDLGLSKGDK